MASTAVAPVPAHLLAADQLEERIADCVAYVAQWRKDACHAKQQELQHCVRELKAEIANLAALQASLTEAMRLTEAAAQHGVDSAKAKEAARRNVAEATLRAEAVQASLNQLLEASDAQRKVLRHEEGAFDRQRCQGRAQADQLQRFLSLYKERLGLELSRVGPQAMRVAFSLLRSDDCQDVAVSFTLRLSETTAYEASDCNPPLPQFDKLLAHLNAATGSPFALAAFFCGVRRAFKALVSDASAAVATPGESCDTSCTAD